MLKVLDLSGKVNFTLEKLLGHDLLLILFAFSRICVFLHFALVSTVNVLGALVEHLLMIQLVRTRLYGLLL